MKNNGLYKNKYRIASTRLKYWDYANPGLYFITICTHNHNCDFGFINEAKINLNTQGVFAFNNWKKIRDKFENVILDEFVVMPNHVHGIIIITKNENDKIGRAAINHGSKNNTAIDGIGMDKKDAIKGEDATNGGDAINRVSSGRGGITGENNPMNTKHSVSKIIRWYKGRCTFEIRKNIDPGFKWQSRFYDHIIRNEKSYLKIKEYIRYNPNKWEDDRYYESRLYT